MDDRHKIVPPSRTAVVLGGGGTQAFFEVWALSFLEKYKIPIDEVVGVSAGSIIGASFVSENFSTKAQIKEWLSFKNPSDIFKRRPIRNFLSNFGMPESVYTMEKLEEIVSRIDFKKLIAHPKTFIAATTEIPDNKAVYFSNKNPEIVASPEIMKQAILASSAIFGVFPSVKMKFGGKTRELIDGAAKRPLPLKKVIRYDGCNTVIVIRCRSSSIKRMAPKKWLSRMAYDRGLSLNNAEKDEINFIRERAFGVNLFVIEPEWLPETLSPYGFKKGDFERVLKQDTKALEEELRPLLEYYGV